MSPSDSPRARIEGLPEGERAAAAAGLIRSLDPAALGRLPVDELQILAYHASRLPDVTERLGLIDKIYALDPLSRDFRAREADRMKALAAWMAKELDTDALGARWPNLPEAERLDLLTRIIHRHDEIAGIAPHARIALMHVRKKNRLTLIGDYSANSRVIRLNAGPDGIFDNLTACLSTLIHENTHHQQHARVIALDARAMPAGHPDLADTRWFKLAMYLGADTTPLGHAAYRRMPHEIHARANADALTSALSPMMRLARRLGLGGGRPATPVFGARP